MRTAYCPESHDQLSKAWAGKQYGHVPGNSYHDCDVVVSRNHKMYRVHVVQSWGSCQGYDQEHGRREAIGRGSSIREAIEEARDRARGCGIVCDYLEQALCKAEDDAIEAEYKDTPEL